MTYLPSGTPLSPAYDHYARIQAFEQSQEKRRLMPRLHRYLENRRYYFGIGIDPDNVEQPLNIRYVSRVIDKHAYYLWGEWERDIIGWTVTAKGDGGDELAACVQQALSTFFRQADANDVLYRGSIDGGIYGDTVFKLRYDEERGVQVDLVLPEYYHGLWHPLDINQTIEACIAYPMDRQAAYQFFGVARNRLTPNSPSLYPELVTVWEWWSGQETMLVVDNIVVQHQANPYRAPGMKQSWLPLVHIPNLQVNGEYYGAGDAEAIHRLQDELNLRLADMGDIVNYHAHPITVIRGLIGKKAEDFDVGPDAIWDLGRDGQAEYLEWSGTPPTVFQYIELILRVLMDTASLTPVAFGRAEQSQATGIALIIQMLPVIEVARRKRLVWTSRLRVLARRMLELAMLGMTESAFRKEWGFGFADLDKVDIHPRWAPILPRDRAQIVNENVTLLVNKARSLFTALQDLGQDDPIEERRRILDDLRTFGEIAQELQRLEEATTLPGSDIVNREGGKNSDRAGEVT